MSTASPSNTSVLAAVGYSAWFLLLVRLLYLATSEQTKGFAESFGVYVGVGLGLLVLLAIPYFIVRFRAKRCGASMSWFTVMTWTTVIALLLAVGGLYGRLHTVSKAQSFSTVQGEWRCTRGSSSQSTRLVLAPDGSVSSTLEGSDNLIHDPWMRWYVPFDPTGDRLYLLRIKLVSDSNIVVKNPNDSIGNCVR